jgi:hypothetical protein
MVNLQSLLYVFACTFFFIAALPHNLPIRFEWLAALCLTLTLLL